MNDMLYCIRICDESGDFNLTAEMLAALELDFSSWEDRENPRVIHTVYAQDPESAAANLERLRTAIPEWKPLGVRIGALETFEMKKEDWAEAWKKYFHLIPISDRLIIKPSWLECEEKPGRKILEIDPGMAFGTGQHATTFYCLEVIDRLSTDPEVKSLLDAGCGSGILSIAAALLGYSPVDCFDNDPGGRRNMIWSAPIFSRIFYLPSGRTSSPGCAPAAIWRWPEFSPANSMR